MKLSSRPEALNGEHHTIEFLHELITVMKDMREIKQATLPQTLEETLECLDDNVIAIAVQHDAMAARLYDLNLDVINLTLQKTSILMDLKQAIILLDALGSPVSDEAMLVDAVQLIITESGVIKNETVDVFSEQLSSEMTYTFTEEQLFEGVRSAIEKYNNDLAAQLLA